MLITIIFRLFILITLVQSIFSVRDLGPGPGAHHPERCPPMNHSIRPPAYSIKSRGTTKIADGGPGPNAYSLPTCIGPKIPDKPAQGAFSMYVYRFDLHSLIGTYVHLFYHLNILIV